MAVCRLQYFISKDLISRQDNAKPPLKFLMQIFIPVSCYTLVLCSTYSTIAASSKILLIILGVGFLIGGIIAITMSLSEKYETFLTSFTLELPFLIPRTIKYNRITTLGILQIITIVLLIWAPMLAPISETNPPIFFCTHNTDYKPGLYEIDSNLTISSNSTSCFVGYECPNHVRVCDENETPTEVYLKFIATNLTWAIVTLVPLSVILRNLMVEKHVKTLNAARKTEANVEESVQMM